ncbi:MAG TPA: diguanylate cyclase [Burkholderiaceae bacterium]|nr:diguanylate cyclase [Burkholderiaceae bacterium]
MACATFCLALLGLVLRSPYALAPYWPANPVLLGAFILRPRLVRPACWVAVLAAFVATDFFIAGTPVLKSFLLNGINVVGIGVGYLVFRRIFGAKVDFGQPFSMLHLCVVAVASAVAEAVLGGVFASIVSDQGELAGALGWFSEEFLSFITLLPVMLSAPAFLHRSRRKWRRRSLREAARACLPALALVASLLLSLLIKGSGAIAFPVIALSYCALSYRFFTTSLLVAFFTIWTVEFAVRGILPEYTGPADIHGLISLRLAMASIALAPLIIASVMAAQARVLAEWRFMANSDSLTGVLNPRGFYREARALLRALHKSRQPVAVLMMDLDFFKQINDTYGHGVGDGALIKAATLLREELRDTDISGRVGGEEFAVLLALDTPHEVETVAERIRASIEACGVPVEGRAPLRMTVSIGASFSNYAPAELSTLMHAADRALYQAKHAGRNRVCVWRGAL